MMQRPQRSKAGNIYKKRLEEIQMEAPRLKKSSNIKKTKKVIKPKSQPVKRIASRASKPSSSSTSSRRDEDESKDSDDEYLDFDKTPTPESLAVVNEDDESYLSDTSPKKTSKTESKKKLQPSTTTLAAAAKLKATLNNQKNLLNKFKCPYCKSKFAEERYVTFHCKEVHKGLLAAEKKKAKESRAAKNQTRHEFIGHPEMDDDDKQDSEEDGLDIDESMTEVEEGTTQGFVEKMFDDEENIEDYYETIENGDLIMYRCRECSDFQVTSKHIIVSHIQRHLSSSNYPCPYCHFKANNRASLEVHIFNHTGVKPFCCKVCDLSFKCMDDMLDHCNSGHTQSEIQEGTHVEVSTRKSGSMTLRTRRSETEKPTAQSPHKCPYCSERFMSVVNLKTHINIHRIKGTTDGAEFTNIKQEIEINDAGSGVSANRCIPLRQQSKRHTAMSEFVLTPSKSKKMKREEKAGTEIVKQNIMFTEGPPRCKICSKVFLYTTQIDRHMRDVHNFPSRSEVPNLTRFEAESSERTQTDQQELTPVITSVVSRATIPDNSKQSPSPRSSTTPTKTTNGVPTVQKSPTNSPKGSSPAVDSKGSPVKSVYLVIDPTNNTCFPVDTTEIDFDSSENKRTTFDTSAADMGTSGEMDEDEGGMDSMTDTELEEELGKHDKPGMPLFEGADNQNLQHECAVCHEKIKGYNEIVKHFHTHTVGPDFACHICAKKYSSKASLGSHFLIHIGITFSCPVCHKKLAKKQSLLEHIRFHRGERRYTCKYCDKAFITTSSLNRHMKTQHEAMDQLSTGEKKDLLKCSDCPRSFPDQDSYEKHRRAHEIMRMHHQSPKRVVPKPTIPITCQYCGKLWASVLGLTRHLKSAHVGALGQVPPSSLARSIITRNNTVLIQNAPSPLPFPAQTSEVIVTEESSAMKVIDIIDLSDDDDKEAEPSNAVTTASIEIATSNSEVPLGTIVNLDGEDVDAIEVMTSEVHQNSDQVDNTVEIVDDSSSGILAGETENTSAATSADVITEKEVLEVN